MKKSHQIIATAAVALLGLTGCTSAADTASRNGSVAAENFEIQREIIITNLRSDTVLQHVVGRCSLESTESDLGGYVQIMCKQGPDDYRKHFQSMGPDISVTSTQLDPVDLDEYNTRWLFRPQTLIPEIEVQLEND